MRNIVESSYSSAGLERKINARLKKVRENCESILHIEYSTAYNEKVKETVYSVCIIVD